jgi:broad specificity phosphatase PhoE
MLHATPLLHLVSAPQTPSNSMLRLPSVLVLQLTPLLRERCFGSQLELTCHQNYCPAWEGDEANPASKPCGCEDGESVQEVSARVQQLFQVRPRQSDVKAAAL